jgi:hypothetical protein
MDCVHHSVENLDVDSLKSFSVSVSSLLRTEQPKEYCYFVDTEFKKLLSHSKTRWIPLYPSIRMFHIFPVLKSFFLAQVIPPKMV